ncbi:hypothetical protein G7070_08025 [Propioniciclava coleopterorum]|uniref:RiboL-PSP-HEPN domain-containing protein n=1 Tax=Propioniciclava coleopterorum TaxID=2714937 RepID=A0A6G7Y6I0_9ACTN|nr:hypothetical protein [Propioniciclava coleopterorum]QIK72227.1 hypothetical protein G7070_08025 [Propioniciclava coleopterorum]
MPDPLRELSEFAEEAVGDIHIIARDYLATRAESVKTTAVGRFGGRNSGYGDRATQLAVANIAGIVEHYAEQMLLAAGCNPMKIKTWGDKPRAWKVTFNADIEDMGTCPSFTLMRGFYEARNAIMHRRGELTDSQRNQRIFARLMAARIERVGYRIVVNGNTVRSCAEVCVQCVQELDATTR